MPSYHLVGLYLDYLEGTQPSIFFQNTHTSLTRMIDMVSLNS